MDRRLTPFSGRIAHVSLRGKITDVTLTEGISARITAPLTWLYNAPAGNVDRQLIQGNRVTVIDRRDGYAFVMADKDGYCGWITEDSFGPDFIPTHRVSSPATHLYNAPRVQAHPVRPLYLNALVSVIATDAGSSAIESGGSTQWAETPDGYIPARHLCPIDTHACDPVAVAESLRGTPYLWAGNSAAGIDCSGLVQMSLHAAGIPCPGDSDLQQALGRDIPNDSPLMRGDLLFWKGHVAFVSAPHTILHANGHSMDVSFEPLEDALTRISLPLLARRRL